MSKTILEALDNLAGEKNIPKETLIEAIEAALISAYKKSYPEARKINVVFDRETGEVRVFNELLVVADEEEALNRQYPDVDDLSEHEVIDMILLEEARQYIPEIVPGDKIEKEVTPKSFGRIATLTAKQVILQRIREAERSMIMTKYSKKIGDIVTGRVQRVSYGEVFVELDGTMAKMEKNEKIEGEYYDTSPGNSELLKFLVIDVVDSSTDIKPFVSDDPSDKKKNKRKDKSILIYLSRADKKLVTRLFELEVPEIHDGVVLIKGVSRVAGKRSKLAVHAVDVNIDAVGACVGQRGSRVQRVVNELRGEKIDIINWSEIPRVFIANALSPAHVVRVDLDEENRRAHVVVKDNQLTLAIGPEGINAQLASELTGWSIDIKSESQDRGEEPDYIQNDEEIKEYESYE